jgi:hypothetical protein
MWELGSGNKVKLPLSGPCKLHGLIGIVPIERNAVAARDSVGADSLGNTVAC